MSVIIVCTVLSLIAVGLLWSATGCRGRYIKHGEFEEKYQGEFSHSKPVFDKRTGEAYTQTFDVYKKECERCGQEKIWDKRYEKKEENRWEPDTVKEMGDS